MNTLSLLEQLMNGIGFGLVLFLMAAGLTIVFGVMDTMNLAHGTLFMLAGPYALARAGELLAPYRAELGLPPEPPSLPPPTEFDEQLDVILESRIPVLSFVFGVPDAGYLALLQEAGITTMATATPMFERLLIL